MLNLFHHRYDPDLVQSGLTLPLDSIPNHLFHFSKNPKSFIIDGKYSNLDLAFSFYLTL